MNNLIQQKVDRCTCSRHLEGCLCERYVQLFRNTACQLVQRPYHAANVVDRDFLSVGPSHVEFFIDASGTTNSKAPGKSHVPDRLFPVILATSRLMVIASAETNPGPLSGGS